MIVKVVRIVSVVIKGRLFSCQTVLSLVRDGNEDSFVVNSLFFLLPVLEDYSLSTICY